MSLDTLRRLYAHMEWADALVWRKVLGHAPSAADPFIRESLLHSHLVQRAYLTGWTGDAFSEKTLEDFPTLVDMREWGRTFFGEVDAFLEGLGEAELQEPGPVLWPELIEEYIGQPPAVASLGDMVIQVATHSVHHRAQINRRIRELGAEPDTIDYVIWVWLGCPAPDWS